MNLSIVAKICIPILSAIIPFWAGSEFQHILIGLSLGFLVDIIWILIENAGALRSIENNIAPLHQLIDHPLKRIDERREYITDILINSDEVIFVTHTATGWLSNYVHEFETRLSGKKKTILLILDPNTDSFTRFMNSREKWHFNPSELKLPSQFLSNEYSNALRQIDNEYRDSNGSHREHFEKKYHKIVDILKSNKNDTFEMILMPEQPSITLIVSRKEHYSDEFFVVFGNSRDSNFDLLAKINVNSGKVFQLYMDEFRRISNIYQVRH